jgi:hypothetical protein
MPRRFHLQFCGRRGGDAVAVAAGRMAHRSATRFAAGPVVMP